jgi:hypothetical protein
MAAQLLHFTDSEQAYTHVNFSDQKRATQSPKRSIVSVIDYAEFAALEERLKKQRGPSGQAYETWQRYDRAIRKIMRRLGKSVGWDEGVDFYHGGDWFHELYNGFALKTTTAISNELLIELQKVVAGHSPNAVLSFGGDIETPMCGLEVPVTATGIFAGWFEESAETCRRKIKKSRVQIL